MKNIPHHEDCNFYLRDILTCHPRYDPHAQGWKGLQAIRSSLELWATRKDINMKVNGHYCIYYKSHLFQKNVKNLWIPWRQEKYNIPLSSPTNQTVPQHLSTTYIETTTMHSWPNQLLIPITNFLLTSSFILRQHLLPHLSSSPAPSP